jgi:hypothetical protein
VAFRTIRTDTNGAFLVVSCFIAAATHDEEGRCGAGGHPKSGIIRTARGSIAYGNIIDNVVFWMILVITYGFLGVQDVMLSSSHIRLYEITYKVVSFI